LRPSIIFFLYRAALAIASPFILLYLLWRGLRDRRYLAGLGQRLGLIPHAFHQTAPGAIWLHAVSVGEVQAASGLLEKVRREIPDTRVFVSVGTVAGRQLADQKLKDAADEIKTVFNGALCRRQDSHGSASHGLKNIFKNLEQIICKQ